MFGKNKEQSFGTETKMKIGTIIGEGAVFDGNISAPDSMRIDGTINGNCRSEKELILGASGSVEGNIYAQNIKISGKVTGDLFADGKLELLSTGKIFGNISAKSLVIDENASFDGRCTMTSTAAQDTNSSGGNSDNRTAAFETSDKEFSAKGAKAHSDELPPRDFVRISADSGAASSVDMESQAEPVPARRTTRTAKTTIQ